MSDDVRVYTNGAFIPRHVAGGRPMERPFWRVGNLLLTQDALELTTKTDRYVIPFASVTSVGAVPSGMIPPPVSLEQMAYVQHTDGQTPCATAIAFPRATVKNFPLQLAAMLTGTVRVYVPRGNSAQAGYDEARLRFVHDQFRVQHAVGEGRIPLDAISSVAFSRTRDANGREYLESGLHYVESGGVRSLTFLSYERVQFLQQLLYAVQGLRRNASLVESRGAADSLPETAQQVAVLLYTGGVTAASIEGMLGLKPDDVDRVYEQLLKLGLAEVVKLRKEIALTPAGMKVVDDIMKKQLTASG